VQSVTALMPTGWNADHRKTAVYGRNADPSHTANHHLAA